MTRDREEQIARQIRWLDILGNVGVLRVGQLNELMNELAIGLPEGSEWRALLHALGEYRDDTQDTLLLISIQIMARGMLVRLAHPGVPHLH